MTYQISIAGMHCTGCQNLIKISLEDAGLTGVHVSLDKNQANFSSDQSPTQIQHIVTKVFSELKDYKSSNLTLI